MKIVKTANGKETIKISKKDWFGIGKTAGWLKVAGDEWDEEARLRGKDPGDAYDLRRDYGGDIDAARADREQQSKPKVDEKTQELYDTLDSMWDDKLSIDYEAIKERIGSGDYKNKFHLINSIKKALKEPSKPASKFERKWDSKGYHPLPPEVQAERKQQRAEMVKALSEQLNLKTYEKNGEEVINPTPWGQPDHYPYFGKISEIFSKGVEEGKWDEYLTKEMDSEIERSFDISIR